MTTGSWWLVVTALCGLLAVASSASAECAWVLWSHVFMVDARGALTDDFWSVDEAYPDRQECISFKSHAGRNYPQYPKSNRKVAFFCFPDTVDPCGPKGGGR